MMKWQNITMNALPALGDRLRLQIDAMDDEGRGRTVLEPAIDVAVRGAFLGDIVEAEVEKIFSHRQLVICRTLSIIEVGPCHTTRICPHTAPCPACPLHGVDRSLAHGIKKGRIERALEDAGLQFAVDDVWPHPSEYGYRQKVKLMVGGQKNDLRLGLYVPYSHYLVPAHQCPYVNPAINQSAHYLLQTLNQLQLEPDTTSKPGLKAIILRAAKKGVAAIVVTRARLTDSQFSGLKSLVDTQHLLTIVERHIVEDTNNILAGKTQRFYGPQLIDPLEGGIAVDPDSFCQSDPVQAKNMYQLVADYLTHVGVNGWFIDAYAGVGGFSQALLEHGVRQIVAIEQSPSCRASLSSLGVQVEMKPIQDALPTLKALHPLQGLVVDPPKKGLMQDAIDLAQLAAPRLVLVSCDPDAMARDLVVFLEHGYSVERILPIDLFGGTPAIETVVFMTK